MNFDFFRFILFNLIQFDLFILLSVLILFFNISNWVWTKTVDWLKLEIYFVLFYVILFYSKRWFLCDVVKNRYKNTSSSVRVERLKLFECLLTKLCMMIVPLSCYQSSYWIVTDCDFVGTLPRVVKWRVVSQWISLRMRCIYFLFYTASFEFLTNKTYFISATQIKYTHFFPLNVLLCVGILIFG